MKKYCKFCSNEFETTYKIKEFCTKKCRSDYHYKKRRKPPNKAICKYCGIEFEKRAAFNHSCIKCKMKHDQGIVGSVKTDIIIRDNTDREAQLIKEYLKK